MVPVDAYLEPEGAPIPDWVLEKLADAEARGLVPLSTALVWDDSGEQGAVYPFDADTVFSLDLPIDIDLLVATTEEDPW